MGLLNATFEEIAVSTNLRQQTGMVGMSPQKLAKYFTQIHFDELVVDATQSVVSLVQKSQWDFFFSPINFITNLFNILNIRRCLGWFP